MLPLRLPTKWEIILRQNGAIFTVGIYFVVETPRWAVEAV
jgi:hypothetical protein